MSSAEFDAAVETARCEPGSRPRSTPSGSRKYGERAWKTALALFGYGLLPSRRDTPGTDTEVAPQREEREEAGRMEDGCSTEAAFAIFTAWRIAGVASGKYPHGKHWNGPEMKYHVTEADKEAARARESAAWAARAATGEFVCPPGAPSLQEGRRIVGLRWPARADQGSSGAARLRPATSDVCPLGAPAQAPVAPHTARALHRA